MIRFPAFLHRWLNPVLMTAALAACSRHESSARPDPVTPVKGGELVFAFDGAAITAFGLDPQRSLFAPHHRIIRSIFDSLVVLQPGGKVGPWLASSWEISTDGRVYTFKLRDGVVFHDGTKLDAAAVKFNLDRIKDPKNALYAIADIGPYERSEVLDPLTLKVTLSAPFAPLLANLSKSTMGIVSPAAVQKYGDQFLVHPVGSGPFRFVSQQPGTEVVLERNEAYRWAPAGAANGGPAWLDRLVFKNVPEEATRVAVLQNGQAGAADIIPPQHLLALRKDPQVRIVEGELLNHNYALFLNTRRAPWSDENVRRAFKLALDIDTAVKTVHLGTLARAWAPLSPSIPGYDKRFENSWQQDKAESARLLDTAGWKPGQDGIREKDGKRLTLVFLETQGNREKRLDLLTVFRRQLADAGIELRIETVSSGNYLERSAAGDYDLLGGSQFASDPDVLRRIHSAALRSRISVSKVDDPALEQLLDAGAREQEPARRAAIYVDVQQRILDKTYAVPIYVLVYFIATRSSVHGVQLDAHGFPVFDGAWVEKAS
ncbi:ABC transporter substrate-binding protein [Pelomonas sp. KK5]|uniref:ABC transporter substrate-binding protein n=1 Tax=Pelomonas sp. KK5 TaxID=1855730 RepID=UPI00097BE51B|nr:ABC transporter substrate-binding protein [Pelomonas sp. KK5]